MIDWLIFSRDRPMQLQALLDSMDACNVPRLSISCLYHPSTPRYDRLYEKVMHPLLRLRRDHSGFQNGVNGWLNLLGPVVGFLTDDCLFYRNAIMPYRDQLPYTYRLGQNTVSTSTMAVDSPPPEGLSWDWHGKPGDFGYPLALDGHIYLLDDLLPVLDGLNYTNPTELEAGMAANWQKFEPARMHMGEHSCLVSIPHNRVSPSSGCPISGDPRYTVEALAFAFERGERIRPAEMDFSNVTDAHQEIPYVIH